MLEITFEKGVLVDVDTICRLVDSVYGPELCRKIRKKRQAEARCTVIQEIDIHVPQQSLEKAEGVQRQES